MGSGSICRGNPRNDRIRDRFLDCRINAFMKLRKNLLDLRVQHRMQLRLQSMRKLLLQRKKGS